MCARLDLFRFYFDVFWSILMYFRSIFDLQLVRLICSQLSRLLIKQCLTVWCSLACPHLAIQRLRFSGQLKPVIQAGVQLQTVTSWVIHNFGILFNVSDTFSTCIEAHLSDSRKWITLMWGSDLPTADRWTNPVGLRTGVASLSKFFEL